MKKIIIRAAKIEDAEQLAQAEQIIAKEPGFLISQPEELPKERFKETIKKLLDETNGKYLVAELNNKIIGHAFLECMTPKNLRHVAFLTIVVHTGHQSKGIGTRLLENLISWAKKSDIVEKILLHVRASNTRAINLYNKFNFVEQGRFTNWVIR